MPEADTDQTALVTGGNRGMGFEACRQLARRGIQVVLAARDPDKGEDAARRLINEGLDVLFERLDVTDGDSMRECAQAWKMAVLR